MLSARKPLSLRGVKTGSSIVVEKPEKELLKFFLNFRKANVSLALIFLVSSQKLHKIGKNTKKY